MLEQLFDYNFLNKATTFSIPEVLITLGISFILGLFIYIVYQRTYVGVMYSSSFGITLIGMNMITALVILVVSSNIITSLGMVGALSIIRFRTVVKEPLDLVYLFWSITTGIIVGAGVIPLAIIGAIIIGLILFVFTGKKTKDTPYVLVVNCENEESEIESMKKIQDNTKRFLTKSKSVSKDGIELTIEVRLKDSSTQFLNKILDIGGITNAVLVSYNGDYYM